MIFFGLPPAVGLKPRRWVLVVAVSEACDRWNTRVPVRSCDYIAVKQPVEDFPAGTWLVLFHFVTKTRLERSGLPGPAPSQRGVPEGVLWSVGRWPMLARFFQ